MDLELGSGSFIPGFEDQLVGAKVGDVAGGEVDLSGGLSVPSTSPARMPSST